jgi:hypothetical protein
LSIWVVHLQLLENKPRAIYQANVPGGEVMEQRHARTVNEGDAREIQGKPPTFGQSLITARTEFIDRRANDLAFYQQRRCVAGRLSNRYPYHQFHILGTLSVMQVKSQFISRLELSSQHYENKQDTGFIVMGLGWDFCGFSVSASRWTVSDYGVP